jgi:cytidylate kinase
MVVTISNEYGSGALAIAKRTADELGYRYVDRQLPVVVAKRLRISPEDVDANEDTGRTIGERLLAGLERTTPEVAQVSDAEPFDEELLKAVQQAVRDYARRDKVVIVGRGGALILGRVPSVVRVFLYAPRDWRVHHVAAAYRIENKAAEAEVDLIDRMRAAYLHDWYGAEFGDPRLYDLCIDTSRFDEAEATAVIVSAVRARSEPAQ